MSEIQYNFEEIYFINSIKFKLHYFKKDQHKELVRRVDSFMQIRKPGQNSEVYFLADGEEIRLTFTSWSCCSVYYKRKRDLESSNPIIEIVHGNEITIPTKSKPFGMGDGESFMKFFQD